MKSVGLSICATTWLRVIKIASACRGFHKSCGTHPRQKRNTAQVLTGKQNELLQRLSTHGNKHCEYLYVCMCVCMCAYIIMYVYMCFCMYACMHAIIYSACIYIYIYNTRHIYISLYNQGPSSGAQSAAVTHTGDWALGVPTVPLAGAPHRRLGPRGSRLCPLRVMSVWDL